MIAPSSTHYHRLTTLLAALLFCLGVTAAPADPQYFWSTGTNTEAGDHLGKSSTGNPATWAALHSQLAGEVLNGRLRIASQKGANWTFLWTRDLSDTSSYKLVPSFTIEKDFQGHVAMQVGFDGVFDHTQIPWPKGYWSSIEDEFNAPMAQTGSLGACTLNESGASITVPRIVTKVYLRVVVTDSSEAGKFLWIDTGTCLFTPMSAADTGSPATSPSP